MRTRTRKFKDGNLCTELIDDKGQVVYAAMGKHSLKAMLAKREWAKRYEHLAQNIS